MLRVLIAEDDLMIADMAEELLIKHGYDVCGIARTVAQAVSLSLRYKPDLAIIDVRLADGGLGTDIPAQLGTAGTPGILYATANITQAILTAVNGHACLAKPYSAADLLQSLKIVTGLLSSVVPVPPFPHGFQLIHSGPNEAEGSPHGWQRLGGP